MKKKKENEIVQLELELDEVVEEPVEEAVDEVVEEAVDEVVEEVVNEVVEEAVDEVVEEVVNEVVEEPVEEIQNGEEVNEITLAPTGTVIAAKLNVREKPSKDAKVVYVLNKGDVVVINESEENYADFYKIVTADGLECYCMKQFIKLN